MGAELWGMIGRDTTKQLEREKLRELRMKFELQFKIRLLGKFPKSMEEKAQH